ncbi:unnamed protein product [Aphanomyces euteiches]
MERYQKERDQLRDEKLHWESEKIALGHRFLNWVLKNHTLSSSTSADLAVRAWSESKKRPGDKPLPSSSKRQKSSKRDSTPTLKDMFGSDDSDDGTGSIFQSLKKVYEKVYKSKPWRRYWYATGPFLPDLPYSKPRLPKDKEAVDVFNEELSDFWKHCAEDVWTRMFTMSTKADNKAWERLTYRLTRLVAELYILIHTAGVTGVSESLVRFLCHPHPSWPQVFKKPISLPLIAKQMSVEVAINYLKSESKKFWPDPEIERMLDSPEEEENPDVEDQESVHTIDSD